MENKKASTLPFWKEKSLREMNASEWESLCDNCGLCCLHKVEETQNNEYLCTNIACKLLDLRTGRCKDYLNRKQIVPDCVQLTPKLLEEIGWLPDSCAYRLVHEGKGLYDWHPLISGTYDTVLKAGIGVQGRTVSETLYKDGDHAIEIWLKEGRQPLWKNPIPPPKPHPMKTSQRKLRPKPSQNPFIGELDG